MNAKKNETEIVFNFEKSLAELEIIIKEMEGSGLSLEKSLEHFERGVTLIRQCQNVIKQAEQKVQILVGGGNAAELQSYSEEK